MKYTLRISDRSSVGQTIVMPESYRVRMETADFQDRTIVVTLDAYDPSVQPWGMLKSFGIVPRPIAAPAPDPMEAAQVPVQTL